MPDIHQRSVVACSTTIVTCVDWRIHQKGLQNFVPREHWPADVRTEPGAAYSIVHDPARRDHILTDLALLVDAHSAETLFLLSHTDCAKYGGKEKFANEDHEYRALWIDLEYARRFVMAIEPLRSLTVKIGIIRTGTAEVLRFL